MCYAKDDLARHHIIKFGRSDEWSNLMVLCCRCHCLAHGQTIRSPYTGQPYPTLSLGVFLTVKHASNPELFDMARLQELYGQTLPDMEPVPEWIFDERIRNKPRKGRR